MKTAVVIPNFNGEDFLGEAIDSILAQSAPNTLIVVDNDSHDHSREILKKYGDKVVTIFNQKNLGFTGGVNTGIRYALENGFEAVALFNNDAIADKDWLKELQKELNNDTGISTGMIRSSDNKTIDSTGDILTVWGLSYPRGRGKPVSTNPNTCAEYVFGASGGATLYSTEMLQQIGPMDDDFFAYYEDVDISFRAQLAGWKVRYSPAAVSYHRISATSSRMSRGFRTYHSVKNMPMLIRKNTPSGLRRIIYPRFFLAYTMFLGKALFRGEGWAAFKGFWSSIFLIPKKMSERKQIQAAKKVSNSYILSILTHDLPENARKLRRLRSLWWKLRGKTT